MNIQGHIWWPEQWWGHGWGDKGALEASEWNQSWGGDNCGAGDEGDATEDDDDEGWVDECEEMTKEELLELAASVQPVRLLLTKVTQ